MCNSIYSGWFMQTSQSLLLGPALIGGCSVLAILAGGGTGFWLAKRAIKKKTVEAHESQG